MSRVLHPLYDRLSRSGVVARFVPAVLRPRIVAFHAQGQVQLRLVVRKRIVGRFDDETRRWQIRWPFRRYVDERVLQKQRDDGRTGVRHRLVLADGSQWEIAAAGEDAAKIVSHLADAMQLRADRTGAAEPRHRGLERRLLVVIDRKSPGACPAACHAQLPRDPASSSLGRAGRERPRPATGCPLSGSRCVMTPHWSCGIRAGTTVRIPGPPGAGVSGEIHREPGMCKPRFPSSDTALKERDR